MRSVPRCGRAAFWYQGEIDQPANVVWLQIGSEWHRLFFDGGTVFWRRARAAPADYEMPELESKVVLRDLGRDLHLVGRFITGVTQRAIEAGVEVAFDSGRVLRFREAADRTSYDCCG